MPAFRLTLSFVLALLLAAPARAEPPPPPGKLVAVEGRRMHLNCTGRGPGPTVILEAGSGAPSLLWRPVQDRISVFAKVCSYDRAGIGWSEPAPGERGFDTRARELRLLLRRAGVRGPYLLVAHSQGGFVARRFAAAHPREVVGVVLVESLEEGWVFTPAGMTYVQSTASMMETLAKRREAVPAAPRPAAPPTPGLPPEQASTLAALATPAYFRAVAAEVRALQAVPEGMRRPGGFGRLGAIPLTIVRRGKVETGMNAPLEPGWREAQARLADLSGRSTTIVGEQSGHMVILDQPDLVAQVVREMTAQVSRGR
jgi:pimeloyl-ACP methyl ester carboxylesterase